MLESMAWLRELILNHAAFQYLIIFLGAAFGGEPVVITLAFLAAQKVFPLSSYLLVSFLGVVFSDSLYFFIGRTKLARWVIEHRYAAKTIAAIIEAINRLSHNRHMIAFILAKFVIGTRAVIIMYVSKTGLSFGYFLRHNLLAIVLWLSLINTIGYLSGLGFTYFSQILENVYAGIGFLLLVLLTLILAQRWLKRTFVQEEEKILEEEQL